MTKILVTGSGGQLGKCIQKISPRYPNIEFVFKDSASLDITNVQMVKKVFAGSSYDFCVNCAAYTNVEQAEKTPKKAFAVNAEGAGNIAKACKKDQVVLIHISTDYVFDGEKEGGYTINDIPNPINEYGKSKLKGEEYIKKILDRYLIIRTSWLYSEFGSNFYKSILKKAKKEKILHVTDAQLGCPTDANNLAKYILDVLVLGNKDYGTHHFTDGEAMTWFDFAVKILKENGLEDTVKVVRDGNYRSFANRPKCSILV